MLDSLRFVKYVRSFMDGRVRVRHPALRDTAIAGKARAALLRVDGVRDIELNTLSGSALILYDSSRLSQDRLIETGCRWADWLDKAARGQAGEVLSPGPPLPKNFFRYGHRSPPLSRGQGHPGLTGALHIASSLGTPKKKGRRDGVLFYGFGREGPPALTFCVKKTAFYLTQITV